MPSYKRLVAVTIGVTVGFDSDRSLTDKEQERYAKSVAADTASAFNAYETHPAGVPDPISEYLAGDKPVVTPTEIVVSVITVDDEGPWS